MKRRTQRSKDGRKKRTTQVKKTAGGVPGQTPKGKIIIQEQDSRTEGKGITSQGKRTTQDQARA